MTLAPSEIQARLDSLCKPPGSLGDLERIAFRLCEIQQTLNPVTAPRSVSVFAADHGVAGEGVTNWPSSVTGAVVRLMRAGQTASGVFARTLSCHYEVVDVGLLKPNAVQVAGVADMFVDAARRRETGNLLHEPAMSPADFEAAWQTGVARSLVACQQGARVLIGGEMGIGNTTAASCLIGLLAGGEVDQIVGRGAGVNDDQLRRKQQVVSSAIERVRSLGDLSAGEIGRQAGGLEIAALAGFYHQSAQSGRVVLVDGLISTAAALLAESLHPGTRNNMIVGHRSTEPGHAIALNALKLEPVLDVNMRLGEATGALAALPLLDLAAAMMNEMATLSDLELE